MTDDFPVGWSHRTLGALSRAFAGAQAVYLVIPPNFSTNDLRAFQNRVAASFASALEKTGVQHVVMLSSVGADKPGGTGPVMGLHVLEELLNRIPRLNALKLRAAYFMENTLAQAGLIHQMGVAGGPLTPDLRLPMIATRDIGAATAEALLKLDFSGQQTRELLGHRDLTMTEAAAIIGNAIGRPGLTYAQFPDEQLRLAMAQLGMTPDFIDLILEMLQGLNSGHMRALETRSAKNTTPPPTKLS